MGEARDQSYFQHLQSLSRRLGLDGNVSLSLAVPGEIKPAALSVADLYVQPSHEEGFCLGLMEACGTAPRVVGTATGAIPQMLAGDAGARLIPVRSPASMARASAELLTQTVDSGLLPARERRLSKRFNWDAHVRQHEKIYQRLLAGHTR